MVDIRRKGKIVVTAGQPPKDAELIDIVKADERWSTYDLDDGTQIRTRPAVIEMWRVVNEFDNEGNPIYVLKAQNIMSVIAPDGLKKVKK